MHDLYLPLFSGILCLVSVCIGFFLGLWVCLQGIKAHAKTLEANNGCWVKNQIKSDPKYGDHTIGE